MNPSGLSRLSFDEQWDCPLPKSPEIIERTTTVLGSPPATAVAGKVGRMVRLRVRIRFSKQGDLRLIGHRDLMRCLERLFRRAGLALSFSQGFHPKPRMTFPLALAVGIEGLDEVMEVELAEPTTAEELLRRLAPHAPPGLVFRAVEVLPEGSRKARVQSVSYEAPIPAVGPSRPWPSGSSVCWPPRRGRSSAPTGAHAIDLRPLVIELALRRGRAGDAAPRGQPRQRRPARGAGGLGTGRHRAARCPSAPHRRGDLRMTMPHAPPAAAPAAANAYWSVLPNKKART